MEGKNDHTVSRRKFLKKLWGWLGIIAGIELAGLSLSFFSPAGKERKKQTSGLVTVGKVGDIPNGAVLPFRSGKFYLVRLGDGGFLALSLKCSHLGCSVVWNKEENKFMCPCHSSQFDINGNVLSRPAPRALDYFPVTIQDGEVKVDTGRPVRRKVFEKSQAAYA